MKNIKLITFLEYFALSKNDKAIYDMVIESTLPESKTIRAKYVKNFIPVEPKHDDLWDFPFADIISIKSIIEKTGIDLIQELSRIVYSTNIDFVCVLDIHVFNWIIEALAGIVEAEDAELNYEPTEEEKAAGIDNLKKFGFIPMIKALTHDDITKEKEILAKPYHEIFTDLAYQKTINDIKIKLYAGR